jgi:AIPR protein
VDVVIEDAMQKFQAQFGLADLTRDQLFETFAAYCVVGQFYEDDFEPDDLRMGGPGDLGIDAAAVVINGSMYTDANDVRECVAKSRDVRAHFVVIQAKAVTSFQSDVFTHLGTNLHHIFGAADLAFNASDRVKNFHACAQAVYAEQKKLAEKPRLSVWYATGGTPDNRVLDARQDAAVHQLNSLNIFSNVQVRPVGARELRELYQRAAEAVTATLTVERHVELNAIPGVNQAFLGVVSAQDFVTRILTDPVGNIRSVLFHENVRAFQGYGVDSSANKVGVNAEIQRTIRDDSAQTSFPVLNNGITIVARNLSVVRNTFTLRDFQIVNGCQTSYVLFDEQANLAPDTQVTIKIICSADENLISRIVAATNRQINITRDDLSVRDKVHKDIETYFPAHPNPRKLYYERRPKQYASDPMEKTRIISRQQLTKAYAAMFLDEAHRVTRLSELIDSRGDDIFRDNHDPLDYYTCASAFYRIEWLLRNGRLASTFGPAKYHLVAGVKTYILGPDRLPTGVRLRKAACEKILAEMWDIDRSAALVLALLPPILEAAQLEGRHARLSDAVRTSRFRMNALNGVMKLYDGRRLPG